VIAALLTGLIAANPAICSDLRCEYLSNPITVDSPAPRLSWIIETEARNWRQSSYRIEVATSLERLKSKPDLWDTGKTASRQTSQIPYAGRPLTSGEQCYWRVETWDGHDVKSGWSQPATWQMGLLTESAWQGARWIGGASTVTPAPAPLLWHRFNSTGRVMSATLYVCGLGYAELHLNGQKLEPNGERDPAYTNFDKRVLYVGYDVTSLIRPGANKLGAILGTGWYDVRDRATWHFDQAPWKGQPRMRLLLAIRYAGGRMQDVVSGGDWKTADSPIRYDGIYTGEIYDSRLEVPGWDRVDSRINGASARLLNAPKGKLVARTCPGVAITDTIAPKLISQPKPGVYIVDFGQNLAGHVQLRLNSPGPAKITMRYSERIGPDGMIERSQINQFMTKTVPPQPFQTDTFITSGGKPQVWEQRFSYSGFRYAEITGFPGTPTKENFRARFAHTDLASAGDFQCSDPMLNKIQRATRWSYLSNAQSIPTDCPQREKNGWTGDAQLAAEAGLMNFASPSFYTKWLNDFGDTQRENGRVSIIVPTGGWGAGDLHPAWDSAYAIIADDLYHYCGDTRILAQNYDHIRRYVDALVTKTKDGVVPFDSLGDWVPWKTQTPSQFTSTGYLYLDERIVAHAASLLGRVDDVKKYNAMADATKAAFNAKFYDADKGLYSNGSQTAESTALYFGLVPDEKRAEAFNALVANIDSQHHIDTGIIGAKNVLRVLSEGGRTDLAYRLVVGPDQPSWGWWINQGATTLWEDWKGESSLNHIMFGDVSNWMMQWIAGIGLDPASPGFDHVVIRPQPVGSMTWASAWHDSPHGRIVSSWSRSGRRLTLKVTIPANSTASVWVPGRSPSGGRVVRHEAERTLFEIGSGSYVFRSMLK
jgi:alpha-L-rhamnosidase